MRRDKADGAECAAALRVGLGACASTARRGLGLPVGSCTGVVHLGSQHFISEIEDEHACLNLSTRPCSSALAKVVHVGHLHLPAACRCLFLVMLSLQLLRLLGLGIPAIIQGLLLQK